ncbi:demethylmenaquinone methyltransferase [Microlunatus endophyticus]|uniref:Putative 4-hydroxy-4-methyl-2-oxoglutarate aldolase n=1 Tax=Microlunatus endophyticus TaxID=1716077 RepID=A0A917W7B9_9ACTN|nr:RraA family protein [Microlunatus endophyticus]GGL71747.1 demethylmenaquinone methyltransferase [Microlunatus endophyticus]
MLLNREQIIALTPLWDGPRSDDGRPLADQSDLEALAGATAEHAWSVLDKAGYKAQYVGHWTQSNPGRNFVGRAVTCQFMPFRQDFHESVVQEGLAIGQTVGGRQNTWVIEALGPGDVLVADIFGKIVNGTVVGDNLGTAVASRTGVGAVIDGGVRDLDGLRELEANFYFRDTDPTPIRDVVLSSMNGPVMIGGTTVLPGDVVLGTERGVTFIPPQLVSEVAAVSLRTAHRDLFGKQRLAERVYTTTEIDTGEWAPHIQADYDEWTKTHPVRLPQPSGTTE